VTWRTKKCPKYIYICLPPPTTTTQQHNNTTTQQHSHFSLSPPNNNHLSPFPCVSCHPPIILTYVQPCSSPGARAHSSPFRHTRGSCCSEPVSRIWVLPWYVYQTHLDLFTCANHMQALCRTTTPAGSRLHFTPLWQLETTVTTSRQRISRMTPSSPRTLESTSTKKTRSCTCHLINICYNYTDLQTVATLLSAAAPLCVV
jgi:hypothetical protein